MRRLSRLLLSLTFSAFFFLPCSCEVHHFIADGNYRKQMEADLAARLSQSDSLAQFYSLDRHRNQLGKEMLTTEEVEALDFLYSYMPLADLTDYPTSFYLDNVKATFRTRKEMGWKVPERIFRHFVLPLRVNNENLDSSRVVFYRELKPRIQGMNMKEAILEVNHWCHEKLTYQPSDGRTLSPLASVRSSLGRCGEESTFTVAALRSVGIPARQVYTPRWAHTDDNHAWVEAWADGEWYFMGACEPEPVLNLGWFNAPASRGLLMHTKVFGRYDGPEEKVMEGPNFTEINLIDNYAETAKTDFKIVDETGAPVDSALVEFKIYNYSEFYPALSKYSDARGETSLTAGKGDMLVWASKDGKFGYSKVSFGKDPLVKITLSEEHSLDPQSFMMVPPPEKARIPEVTQGQRDANNLRFAREDSLRKAYMSTFAVPDGTEKGDLLAMSAGNRAVIGKFLEDHPDERAIELLKSLSNKDLKDVTRNILEDSYKASGSILCPRVENEFLSPYKSFFLTRLTEAQKRTLSSPDSLVIWIHDNIRLLNDPKAWSIPMSPEGVFRSRLADPRSRDIFFVALSRTLGTNARKNPVTGSIQYEQAGQWHDVNFDSAVSAQVPEGTVVLNYSPSGLLPSPRYYSNFTISRIVNGRTSLLTFDEGQVDMGGGASLRNFSKGVSLAAGEYVLVSGNRLSDGSVPVSMRLFKVEEGKKTALDLKIEISKDKLPVIGSFDSETMYLVKPGTEAVSILSTTGRGFYVLGYLLPGKEPSVHAVNDIIAARENLEKWGRPILLLTSPEGLGWINEYSGRLPSNVRIGIVPEAVSNGHVAPYFIIADTFNRVFYSSEGYSIGLGEQLVSAIKKL